MRYIAINYNDMTVISLEADNNGKAVERLETLLIKQNPGNRKMKLTNHNGIFHRNEMINDHGFEICKPIGSQV